MKYSVIIIMVLCVVAGSGCMYDAYRQRMWEDRYMHRRSMPQQEQDIKVAEGPLQGPGPLEEAQPEEMKPEEAAPKGETAEIPEQPEMPGEPEIIERTQRKIIMEQPKEWKGELLDRKISVGLSLGNAYGNKGDAIDGNEDADFENGMILGLRVCYMPAMRRSDFSPKFITRYGLELRLENTSIMLSDAGLDLGALNMNTAVFAFKLMQQPEEGDIFGFHFDVGLGWASTWFEKSNMLEQNDIAMGWHTKIDPGQAQIVAFGAGVDLVVGEHSTVSMDLRHEITYVPVSWSINGIYDTDIEWLDASNTRLVFGFNFWF